MAPKSRANADGLGRAIINRKVKDFREAQTSGRYSTDLANPNRLQSVTQERDLDAFLSAASLAETDFTAERRNVNIVSAAANATHNPHLLSVEQEQNTLRKFAENKQRLRVPRRPAWKKDMTKDALDRQEKDAFIEWRRGLADLQDRDKFLLTPFERNIEVWRQLWRVLERSQLVVQIVDARNPLRFRCEDLESYVHDVEGVEGEQGTGRGLRRSLLLINKADLLTSKQRRLWADYFDAQGIQYAFFSALNAAVLQEARCQALEAEQLAAEKVALVDEAATQDEVDEAISDDDDSAPSDSDHAGMPRPGSPTLSSEESDDEHFLSFDDDHDSEDAKDPRTKVLSVLELEDLFKKAGPELASFGSGDALPDKLVVGLVGYPNVGKSSTINALIGEKKVSVSSTPGKTKHFQTIHLPDIILCDCPGLVFPQFATTKADLVCDGVLPIDQLREHTAPVALLVKRIPKPVLEATYGIGMKTRDVNEGEGDQVMPEDLLVPYAIARGFMRAGQGNPDEARAARYLLKDYVNAKLLFCHPPPGEADDAFNQRTREICLSRASKKKRAPVTRVGQNSDTFVRTDATSGPSNAAGMRSRALDQDFFAGDAGLSSRPFVQGSARDGKAFTRGRLYPHQNMVSDDGSELTGRRARIAAVLSSAGADGLAAASKKHKKMRRVKQRSGKGYD